MEIFIGVFIVLAIAIGVFYWTEFITERRSKLKIQNLEHNLERLKLDKELQDKSYESIKKLLDAAEARKNSESTTKTTPMYDSNGKVAGYKVRRAEPKVSKRLVAVEQSPVLHKQKDTASSILDRAGDVAIGYADGTMLSSDSEQSTEKERITSGRGGDFGGGGASGSWSDPTPAPAPSYSAPRPSSSYESSYSSSDSSSSSSSDSYDS